MIFVNSDEQIAEFESHMQQYLQTRESFITVDTEFIRENSATPVLCLIQIATQQKIYLIDPLAVSLKFLDKYFSNSTLIKVFHSAQQDIELLSLNGLNLNRIYDTQLYEMLLSTTENISYQAIVAHYLNKKIYKDYGLSKWAQRPLSHQQLKYAKNDVSYLRDVFIKQQHLLKTLKRDHWLDNEAFIPYENDNSSLEKSINEENLPVLHSLLNQRKQIAERLQTSENFISDDLIKAICKKGTEFIHTLLHSRNIKERAVKDFLKFADGISDSIVIKNKFGHTTEINLLKALLSLKSEEFQICPSLIATSSDLTAFVDGIRSIKFLNGWRFSVFGNAAVDLLNGNIKLGYDRDKKVRIYEK